MKPLNRPKYKLYAAILATYINLPRLRLRTLYWVMGANSRSTLWNRRRGGGGIGIGNLITEEPPKQGIMVRNFSKSMRINKTCFLKCIGGSVPSRQKQFCVFTVSWLQAFRVYVLLFIIISVFRLLLYWTTPLGLIRVNKIELIIIWRICLCLQQEQYIICTSLKKVFTYKKRAYIEFYNIDRTLRALWLVKTLCFIRV